MNLTPIDPRTILSSSHHAAGNSESSKTRDLASLRESTREFEALFINEMFKAMRKTVPDGGLIEKDMTEDIFREMMDMEIAREASAGRGTGIGEDMFEQLRHLIENRLDR